MDDRKTPDTAPRRENGQGEHEGAPHSTDEFDVMNPAKQKLPPGGDAPSRE